MLIAQITDTHITVPGRLINGRVDTRQMLQACLACLNALDPQPDLLVITGDLVDLGEPEEYRYLRELLASIFLPLLVIPGNHDDRFALREAFPEQAWVGEEEYLHYAKDIGPLRILGLDTVVPGEGGGKLCARRLAWLESSLQSAGQRPCLILMHHPPFETGIAHMDRLGLSGREAFAAILARHAQVKLVLCGHLHRSIHATVGGCRVLTCPSTAHQVAFDLRPDGPSRFCMEPPGFMLHKWNGEDFVSHAICIGDYPGPFLFDEA